MSLKLTLVKIKIKNQKLHIERKYNLIFLFQFFDHENDYNEIKIQ